MTLHDKALKITTIVLDVDGVLTDGRIGYGCGSDHEIKFFDVRDGHGMKLALRAGLAVGILSGRISKANQKRASELGLSFLVENSHSKGEDLKKLFTERGISGENVLYIGDDVVDIPPMRLSGIGVAVADAVPELDRFAAFRTKNPGGRGAVRETIEWLLKEQGKWENVLQRYFA